MRAVVIPLLLGLVACSSSTPSPDGGNPGGDAGPRDGGAPFAFYTLDSSPNDTAFDPPELSMSVGPNDVVAVAYLQKTDGGLDGGLLLPDGGIDNLQQQFSPNYEVRYVQWTGGTVSQPQRVQTVQRLYGISVGVQKNGQPAIAYLGGPDKNQSVYWFQQNATVNFRQADGVTWKEDVVDDYSANAAPPDQNPVDTNGNVLGLYPNLIFDSAGTAYFAYRDVHDGQFPIQDWGGSDLKVAIGGYQSWTRTGAAYGGNNKNAYGGHASLAIGIGGKPAVASDRLPGGPAGPGANVLFYQQNSTSAWTPAYNTPSELLETVGNLQTGPSLAYDSALVDANFTPVGGYALAYVDRYQGTLYYLTSRNGTSWPTPIPVYGSGSGGWFPSLAIDPLNHWPSIAFFVCSGATGLNEDQCDAAQKPTLQLATLLGSNWNFTIVYKGAVVTPKLGYLSTGKRVIAFKAPDGSEHLAVEQ